MALSLEAPANVFRKAEAWLNSQNVSGKGSTPVAQAALRGFKDYWMGAKAGANLQFVGFSEAQADDDDGTNLLDAASTVYFFYVKKLASGTDNTVKMFENTTVDTTATQQSLSIPLDVIDQEAFMVYPNGWAQATGLTITQHTTIEGSTDGSDGADGFIIAGAA